MTKFALPTLWKSSKLTTTVPEFEKLLTEANSMWLDAERLFEDFDRTFPTGVRSANFPPRNIVKTKEGYEIAFAVAGFKREDLTVEIDTTSVLTVSGRAETPTDAQFLFKGIATRQFQNKLQLLDGDEISSVKLADGILTITVKRAAVEVPAVRKLTIE